MKLVLKTTTQNLVKTDLLIIPAGETNRLILPRGVKVPKQATQSFGGKSREMRLTDATSGPAARVLFVGLGSGKLESETLRRCGALISQKAEKLNATSTTLWFGKTLGKSAEKLGQAFAEGLIMGAYQLSDFKSNSPKAQLKRLAIHASREFKIGAKKGPNYRRGQLSGTTPSGHSCQSDAAVRSRFRGQKNCVRSRASDLPHYR